MCLFASFFCPLTFPPPRLSGREVRAEPLQPSPWPRTARPPPSLTPLQPNYRPPSARPQPHISPFHPASPSTLPSHSLLVPWLTSLPQLLSLFQLHICPCCMLCNPSVFGPSYTNKLCVNLSTDKQTKRSLKRCQHTVVLQPQHRRFRSV